MLSIIYVNYKTSKDILISLASIAKYEKKFKEYEYIIVDNNSDDGGLEVIKKKYPFVKIIYAPQNGGFAYGNNHGIKQAIGDFIFLLNPDTYINDNAIEKLYYRIKNDNSIGIIGPQLLYPDGENQSYYLPKTYLNLWKLFCERFYLYKIFKQNHLFNSYFKTYMDYSKETYVEQVSGAALLFRKSILENTGLLDENYFMYFEESDFCLQACKHDLKLLYYPKSSIVHIGGLNSESGWERNSEWFVVSFKYYFKKNFTKSIYYTAIIFFTMGSCLKILIFLIKNDRKYKFHFFQLKQILK